MLLPLHSGEKCLDVLTLRSPSLSIAGTKTFALHVTHPLPKPCARRLTGEAFSEWVCSRKAVRRWSGEVGTRRCASSPGARTACGFGARCGEAFEMTCPG